VSVLDREGLKAGDLFGLSAKGLGLPVDVGLAGRHGRLQNRGEEIGKGAAGESARIVSRPNGIAFPH
jgi:hypothetical protein